MATVKKFIKKYNLDSFEVVTVLIFGLFAAVKVIEYYVQLFKFVF